MWYAAVLLPASLLGPAAAPPQPATPTGQIDEHLARGWAKAGVKPARPADDATFLRRVSLDLVGRVPTAAECRSFLADPDPGRRERLVNRLLASPSSARHFATFWRRSWLPQADATQFGALAEETEAWLRRRLRERAAYDDLVRDLLNAPSARARMPSGPAGGREAPASFLTASEFRPEGLAANAARAFLGISLDCAQCHDHPFARWTKQQFWQTAAFFARPSEGGEVVLPIPNTTRFAAPRVLAGAEPRWPGRVGEDTGREVLAAWITSGENPYFARNAANRVWAHFFGVGLVEPLDDLSGDNPPSHPELLDDLARSFVAGGFDLKSLARAIVLSRAYQLSAAAAPEADPRLFAGMPVRALTGEQLYDSLRTAAGLPAERDDLDPGGALRERRRFADRFRVERPAAAERSILQALGLMNGGLTARLTDPGSTPTLVGVADAPFLDARGRVETLFLAALGRRPTAEELRPFLGHVERAGKKGRRQALADVFWALLNSSEFNTNH